jgi:hypothetical protein
MWWIAELSCDIKGMEHSLANRHGFPHSIFTSKEHGKLLVEEKSGHALPRPYLELEIYVSQSTRSCQSAEK